MGILDDAIREHLELKRAHGAAEDELKQKEAEAFGPIRQEAAAAPDQATEMLRPDDLEEELHAAPDVHPDPNAAVPVHHEPVDTTDTPAPAHPAEAPPTEAYDVDALQPATEDPYVVHPGDHAVPDPHDHAHPAGSDPAWADDSELFAEEAPHASPAAEAGAGMLEPGHHSDPGPPMAPEHHRDEQHPALHDHDAIQGEEHPPEPVFRRTEPDPPEAPPEPESPAPEGAAADGEEDVLEETPEFLQDAPEHDRLWFEQKPPRDFDFGE